MTPEQISAKYLTGDFTLKSTFAKADNERNHIITNSERYAGWTLPIIFPNDEVSDTEEMQHDYQSVGAQAVTHLGNKIMMALFQPSRPFFRLNLTAEQKADLDMNPTQVEEALAEAERQAMRELEKINARVVLTDTVLQLIITGNSLVYIPPDGKLQNYSLRDYVVLRDLRGDVVRVIIRETKSVGSLSDELGWMAASEGFTEDKDVTLYTGIQREGKSKYVVWQEMEDFCYCHRSIGIETADTLPWIPLTWNLARNKDYGTGLVENYAGDFHSLSTFAAAILDYGTVITDLKYLVDPAGMTDVREITETPSGGYVHGREEDISVLAPAVASATDFLTAQFSAVERRIGAAFLMNTSVTRDAERVTAEEIRMQAQELEGSLGGVYSRLATELQQPLARRLLSRLDTRLKDIEPIIVTGLESLSRNSELDRLRAFFQDLIALAEVPEQVADRIEYADLISVLGAGHGIDYKKFLKDDAKFKADQEQKIAEAAELAGQEAGAVAQAQQQ
jgi:hypothetical protein